ncbi:MAG: hypothetical protein KC420_03145, partial [Myxococcales bacterium]|nr:hypothetical protein [Myxococcales bacterium]
MPRWFNTAGPCDPADHYMLPVMRRLPSVRRLIDRKAYFVVHAPRQVGKTTSLLALARELTAEGRYCAVLLSLEVGAWASEASAYNAQTGACSGVCGHYTQIVWSSTSALGCGYATCGAGEIWVCNYDPRGNILGQKA